MRSIQAVHEDTVAWLQPKSRSRCFELYDGGQVLQSLEFKSVWNSLAVAVSADTHAGGRWTFKRVGFCNPVVTVRVEGSHENLAVFRPKFWGGGALELPDGRTLIWKSLNFWSSRWAFEDDAGDPVLTYKDGVPGQTWRDMFKSQHEVTLHQPAPAWLSALGLYLLILQQEDGGAAAAVVVTS